MVYKGVEGIVDMLQWAAAAPTNNIVRIFYDSMTRDERERLHAIATSAIHDVGELLTQRQAYTIILNSSEPLKQKLIKLNLYGERKGKWIFLKGIWHHRSWPNDAHISLKYI